MLSTQCRIVESSMAKALSYVPLGTFDFTLTLGWLGAAGWGASSKWGEAAVAR